MADDRILTTHAGSLPRSEELREMVFARAEGEPYDAAVLAATLRTGVAEVVRKQIAAGVDVVNDGELGKTNFQNYVRERLAGFETRARGPEKRRRTTFRRAMRCGSASTSTQKAGGFQWQRRRQRLPGYCIEPLRFIGHDALHEDLDNLKAAVAGQSISGAFMNANTPGTIEHWLLQRPLQDARRILYAIADAMREEYNAIVDGRLHACRSTIRTCLTPGRCTPT